MGIYIRITFRRGTMIRICICYVFAINVVVVFVNTFNVCGIAGMRMSCHHYTSRIHSRYICIEAYTIHDTSYAMHAHMPQLDRNHCHHQHIPHTQQNGRGGDRHLNRLPTIISRKISPFHIITHPYCAICHLSCLSSLTKFDFRLICVYRFYLLLKVNNCVCVCNVYNVISSLSLYGVYCRVIWCSTLSILAHEYQCVITGKHENIY